MVTWNEISEECGDYKAGFIAVFRKYEGEPTDAKDARGRTIKVSVNSFCEHMKIPDKTFREWLRKSQGLAARTQPRNRRKEAIRSDPDGTVDDIMDLPPKVQDRLFHELKLRRAGVDTSKAARKGADAAAHHMTEPFRQAMVSGHVALCVAALKDAREELTACTDEGLLTSEAVEKIGKANEAFQIDFMEARLATS